MSAPMPQRPAMSDSTPAPIRRAEPPSTAVRAARSLWLTAAVTATAAGVFAVLSRGEQLEELSLVVGMLQPDLPVEERDAIAAAVIIGTLAAIAVVVVLELVLVRSMTVLRRGGARWGLLATTVLNVAACAVASTFVIVGAYGALAAGLLAGQLALAGAALVAGFLPSARAWIRGGDEARGGTALVP